MKNILN